MDMTLTSDTVLAADLYALARELEELVLAAGRPRLRDRQWVRRVEEGCARLQEHAAAAREGLGGRYDAMGRSLAEARQAASDRYDALAATLEVVARDVRAYSDELAAGSTARALKARARSLAESYEDLRRRLKAVQAPREIAGPRLERLKPTQYRRNVFHVGMGLVAAGTYQWFLTQGQAVLIMGILLAIVVVLETTRRFWGGWNELLTRNPFFRPIIRPWEQARPNSASWYVLALFLVALVTPKAAAQIGVLVVAFGDPAATLVGRRWGKVKLYRRKSVVGSLAFVAAAMSACLWVALVQPVVLPPLSLAGMALSVALAGAVVELFSDVVDDNLTVPVAAACVATLWLGA